MMREIARKRGNFRGVCPYIGRLRDPVHGVYRPGSDRTGLLCAGFIHPRGVIRTETCTEILSPYEEEALSRREQAKRDKDVAHYTSLRIKEEKQWQLRKK